MSRTHSNEKNSSQFTTSVKPTASFLQTRDFAPLQTDLDEDVPLRSSGYTENFLEKIINQPSTESSNTLVQAKPMNRLKASAYQGIAMIQAKLSIGEPNDKYEKEADDTASKVVQQISSPTHNNSVQKQESMELEDEELQMKPAISKIQRDESMELEDEELQMKSLVQRRENIGGGEASTDLESSIQSARGSGQSLDAGLQAKMGQAMGADFSGVKVHTDSQSDQLNKSIQAKAFTTGQDVFFRQGAYEPSSRGGQELIAHELTHVVQQNGGAVNNKTVMPMQMSLQARTENSSLQQQQPIQKRENNTGLPNNLKAGIENLSGMSLDDVKVHRNSDKPAQLQAHAYTQGTDIHVTSGQEQHLPHEAWHVVQQKQGRVKPTMQMKGKVNVNDNAGLEKEADVMGAKALQTSQTGKSQKVKIETSQGNVVQMAGHSGVMVFSPSGKLLKRVEKNEAKEFNRIMGEQNNEDPVISAPALGAFPKIYRVEQDYNGDAGELLNAGYRNQGKAEKSWASKHTNGDSYVEMQSLGGPDVDILDFKIGKATAHYEDLIQNYEKSPKAAKKKVEKMASVDQTTESNKFGLRDSDAMRASTKDIISRWVGNFKATLDDVDAKLKADGSAYPKESRAFVDLENIYKYLKNSDTVYVASSLVMRWNQDRSKRTEDRVVLIDLAHPIPKQMDGFDEVKAGMLVGIANLHAMLEGKERDPNMEIIFEEEQGGEEVDPIEEMELPPPPLPPM